MKRLVALGLVFGLVVAGCGGVAAPSPSVSASASASASPSATPSAVALKIGMVTDIGQLEDKSFNEFSWKGVQDGATAVGGTAKNIVTKDIADYKQNIQSFIDQKYDIIVTVGFLISTDTQVHSADGNPGKAQIGALDRSPPPTIDEPARCLRRCLAKCLR